MPLHDIITIGASAGGVESILQLVKDLPADLPAAVFVVIHLGTRGRSALAQILGRAGSLPAADAVDGEPIERGRIYVAPANHHLLLETDHVRVVQGAKMNGHRPAIDATMRAAARAHGSRAAGVVLSGALDDGTAGLQAIKAAGGMTIVQSPDDALFPDMPRNALEYVKVDHCLPLAEMASLLTRVARGDEPGNGDEARSARPSMKVAMKENSEKRLGTPSNFACPNCHGVLWEHSDGEILRFECRVGHAFSPQGLNDEHAESLERAIWSAVRTLEESSELNRRLAERARQRGHELVASRFDKNADEKQEHAATLRTVILAKTSLE